jgi:hypothetical protein
MAIETYIDNYPVPTDDIISSIKGDESMGFNGDFTISDEYELQLDNIDRTKYDPNIAGSLFYHGANIESVITQFDTEKNRNILDAIIDNVTSDDSVVTLNLKSRLAGIIDKNCQYSNSSDKTPAQVIYELLTGAANGNIDPAYIVYAGFQTAIALQTAHSLFVDVSIIDAGDDSSTSTMTIGSAINALLKLSHCHLFTAKNLIFLYQWQPYAGAIGNRILDIDLVSGSYKQSFSQGDPYPIYKSYSVAYDSGGSTLFAKGGDTTTGKKFCIPDQSPDSTDSTDLRILIRNATGATWSGAMAMDRFGSLIQLGEFKVFIDLDYIHVGDQVDLCFDEFSNEPCLVYDREVDDENGTISLKVIFLNTPYERFSRDVIAPDAPELISAELIEGGIILKWNRDDSSDHLGYKIYFTSTPGMWNQEICNLGQSPFDCKAITLSGDGYIYQILTQLNPWTQYYFKVTAYDSSFNESDFSNTVALNLEFTINKDIPLVDIWQYERIPDDGGNEHWNDVLYIAIGDGSDQDVDHPGEGGSYGVAPTPPMVNQIMKRIVEIGSEDGKITWSIPVYKNELNGSEINEISLLNSDDEYLAYGKFLYISKNLWTSIKFKMIQDA